MGNIKKLLWIAVTADEYELPICVENTAEKLARRLGTSRTAVNTKCCKKYGGKYSGYRIVRIEDSEEQ